MRNRAYLFSVKENELIVMPLCIVNMDCKKEVKTNSLKKNLSTIYQHGWHSVFGVKSVTWKRAKMYVSILFCNRL